LLTHRQTDRQTKSGKNITFLVELISSSSALNTTYRALHCLKFLTLLCHTHYDVRTLPCVLSVTSL